MKRLTLILLVLIVATTADAGIIRQIQSNDVLQGTPVEVDSVIVTAVYGTGAFVTEPQPGAYSGIFVERGVPVPPEYVGDYVYVRGVYEEVGTVSMIIATSGDPVGGELTSLGEVPFGDYDPYYVTVTLLADSSEAYESCYVWVTDGMIVAHVDQQNSQWTAVSFESAEELVFDDFWYDINSVEEGQCYNWAIGIYWQEDVDKYMLQPFAGEHGIALTNCVITREERTWGHVKALYR